jgi:RNA-splicing ligase RtcB
MGHFKVIKGEYNSAKVFTNNVESKAIEQINDLCNSPHFKDSKIRIMPDVHAGAGCTIGTTMTIQDKIVPNLVGVDISCGMLCVKLLNIKLDLPRIDTYIRNNIPHGFNINNTSQTDFMLEIENLKCFKHLGKSSLEFNRAIGSLGSGNHFIEINEDSKGNKYLVIHSGSRNLGNRVAQYYQSLANNKHDINLVKYELERKSIISKCKQENRRNEINSLLHKLKINYVPSQPDTFAYLQGSDMQDYLSDIKFINQYASINRFIMAERILRESCNLNIYDFSFFTTIHNYTDTEHMMLRKGAVSAHKGEELIIPINMRDGSLLCKGKGNPDWNYSAPHGAGRLMSRTAAKNTINMTDYKDSMKNIFTTSVNENTLDEAPSAYKPMQEIIDNVQDTVEVLEVIKPIYNFKSN